VLPERSGTKKVSDTVGILESYSHVDEHLVEIAPNGMAFRAQEDASFMEGFTQTMENTFFYGSTFTHPERFMGLTPRYNDLSAETAENVFDMGGVGVDNCSIWLVTYDPSICFLFYGKGTNGGFRATDKGLETVDDADVAGAKYEAWVTHFKWQLGLGLTDWRYCGRIANIDASVRDGAGVDAEALRNALIRLANVPPTGKGRSVLYMNKKMKTALEIARLGPAGGAAWGHMGITFDQWAGERTMFIWGIPVRIADGLADNEERVV
jgi:hypothetical protein